MKIELWAGAPSRGASRPPLPRMERNEVRVVPRRLFGATSRLQRSPERLSGRGQAFNPVAKVFTEFCGVLRLRFARLRMTLR